MLATFGFAIISFSAFASSQYYNGWNGPSYVMPPAMTPHYGYQRRYMSPYNPMWRQSMMGYGYNPYAMRYNQMMGMQQMGRRHQRNGRRDSTRQLKGMLMLIWLTMMTQRHQAWSPYRGQMTMPYAQRWNMAVGQYQQPFMMRRSSYNPNYYNPMWMANRRYGMGRRQRQQRGGFTADQLMFLTALMQMQNRRATNQPRRSFRTSPASRLERLKAMLVMRALAGTNAGAGFGKQWLRRMNQSGRGGRGRGGRGRRGRKHGLGLVVVRPQANITIEAGSTNNGSEKYVEIKETIGARAVALGIK